MRARYLRRHQVHVVIESDRQQYIGFPDAGFALDINVNAVALNQFDAFQPGGAAKAAGVFVYDGDLVAPLDKRCYRP
jgi:hypothetical protein